MWLLSAAIGLVAMEFGTTTISGVAPLISLIASVTFYLTQVPSQRRLHAKTTTTIDRRDAAGDPWTSRTLCAGCGMYYTTYEMDTPKGQPAQPYCLDCQVLLGVTALPAQ